MSREAACAALAGGTCIAGLSLSQINEILTTISFLVSIVAAALAIYRHVRWEKNGREPK